MKLLKTIFFALFFAFAFNFASYGDDDANQQEDPYRVFTSLTGSKIEARVINLNEDPVRGEEVVLQRKSDSKTFTVPVRSFVKADREFIANADLNKLIQRPDQPRWFPESDEDGRFMPKRTFDRRNDFFPDAINPKGTDIQPFPMGILGGRMAVKLGSADALISQLHSRSAGAKGGLEINDRLIKVNGKKFGTLSPDAATGGDGVPRDLGLAILEAQASGAPLLLTVLREGKELELTIELPPAPDFAVNFPHDCERSALLQDATADWLASTYKERNNFGSGQMYGNVSAALALLSTGDKRYRSMIRANAKQFSDSVMNSVPNSNWHAPLTGIFLAEYHLATGEKAVIPALRKICLEMAGRVDPATGRLGHNGTSLPYGGKGLVITSVQMHLMWALAEKCGIPIDDAAWKLSYKSIDAALSPNGSVGYNFSAKGSYESMARTACMATALEIAQRSAGDRRRMFNWLDENQKRLTNGHATTSLGIYFGSIGYANAKERSHREFLDYHKWLLALVTPSNPGHGAYYYSKRDNNGGDGYLNYRTVANYQTLMMLTSARDDTLWSYGNYTEKWYKK